MVGFVCSMRLVITTFIIVMRPNIIIIIIYETYRLACGTQWLVEAGETSCAVLRQSAPGSMAGSSKAALRDKCQA
jgi:hypothetical protein